MAAAMAATDGRSDRRRNDRRLAAGSVSSRAFPGETIRPCGVLSCSNAQNLKTNLKAARDHSPRQGDHHDGSQHVRC